MAVPSAAGVRISVAPIPCGYRGVTAMGVPAVSAARTSNSVQSSGRLSTWRSAQPPIMTTRSAAARELDLPIVSIPETGV